MDIVEIPSHFMENFVYDARTLQLFMRGPDAANEAEHLAQHVQKERHLFGALDMELQVRQPHRNWVVTQWSGHQLGPQLTGLDRLR